MLNEFPVQLLCRGTKSSAYSSNRKTTQLCWLKTVAALGTPMRQEVLS